MPDNWVKQYLADQDYGLFQVDGYTVKNEQVTALLDYVSESDLPGKVTKSAIKQERGEDAISAKIALAEELDSPYYIVKYNGQVNVYRISSSDIKHTYAFDNASEFGQWTMSIRDRAITKYTRDTSTWTSLEKELINNDVGAPGDLDSFVYQDGEAKGLIEWQTTNKKSPADHSNNRWFSDDKGRWKPLWTISRQMDLPLVIVVWSPKSKYPGVRIKRVKNIKFNGQNSGIDYAVDKNITDAKSNCEEVSNLLFDTIINK